MHPSIPKVPLFLTSWTLLSFKTLLILGSNWDEGLSVRCLCSGVSMAEHRIDEKLGLETSIWHSWIRNWHWNIYRKNNVNILVIFIHHAIYQPGQIRKSILSLVMSNVCRAGLIDKVKPNTCNYLEKGFTSWPELLEVWLALTNITVTTIQTDRFLFFLTNG